MDPNLLALQDFDLGGNQNMGINSPILEAKDLQLPQEENKYEDDIGISLEDAMKKMTLEEKKEQDNPEELDYDFNNNPFNNLQLLTADSDKKHIIVKFKNEDNYVSWYNECSSSDVKEAIMCACDCMIDSSFQLLDSDGNLIDLNRLDLIETGQIYHLYEGTESNQFQKILGDRWRKVKIEIEPLRHVEAQKAVEIMKIGGNLLKHTKKGNPHIRQFQLSHDMKRIIWYSKKTIDNSQVDLSTVDTIQAGKDSPELNKSKLPSLQHLSFTITYTKEGKTNYLSVTCKDEEEYDFWFCGIKALSYHFHGFYISKMELLAHSREFNELIEANKIGRSSLPFNSSKYQSPKRLASKTLEDLISTGDNTKHDLKQKIKKVRVKLGSLETEIDELTDNMEIEEKKVAGGYRMLSNEEAKADDVLLMKTKLLQLLSESKKSFSNTNGVMDEIKKGDLVCTESLIKELSSKLWKIEIDIENMKDIIKRIQKLSEPTLKEKLKNLFPKFF